MDSLVTVYFVVWAVLGIGTILLFWGRTPAFKKKWDGPVSTINGLIISGFLIVLLVVDETPRPFAVLFFAVMAYMWYGSSKIRICGACGKTVHPRGWWPTPKKYCPRCGANLDE